MNTTHRLVKLLPSVNDCLLALEQQEQLSSVSPHIKKKCIRICIDELRTRIFSSQLRDENELQLETILRGIKKRIKAEERPKCTPLINATGVIIHTNLGRSVLPQSALDMLVGLGGSYSNLEFNLISGQRGSRYTLVEELLCDLTGAEAALVVNNNAAAVLLCLETLAQKREVIVSRGQLVEIGGSFRIPDIMARSGAHLVEVGATNRTHLHDYQNAITEQTALLLKVHCSNYRIIGFTKEVDNRDLVALGREYSLPVMEDLGSGCLIDLSQFGLEKEPTVKEVVASGVDVVTCSGDKLLGGPQAGIILGKAAYIDMLKKNPFNRALRIDKFTLGALEAVLRLYLDEKQVIKNIPTLAMIAASSTEVQERAERLMYLLPDAVAQVFTLTLCQTTARVGGGAMPEQNLPSVGLSCTSEHLSISLVAKKLRLLPTPIIGRLENDALIFDMRTVADSELPALVNGLVQISESFMS